MTNLFSGEQFQLALV